MVQSSGKYDTAIHRMRSRFWSSLPAQSGRLRRLAVRAVRDRLALGEREELELLVKRLADSAQTHGFGEAGEIARQMAATLDAERLGIDDLDGLLDACDELDRFIDDMTIEALAVRLQMNGV